jgi:hypothetical protein
MTSGRAKRREVPLLRADFMIKICKDGACLTASALRFAVKGYQAVEAGSNLAPLNAGFAGNELRSGYQGTPAVPRIAPGIFPAPVTQLVCLSADLRCIRPAGKVKTMAGSQTTQRLRGGDDGC